MSDILLATKIHVPTLHRNLVNRPHLIQQLNAGIALNNRLTLISAPAGYGKSTLLSEWVSQIDIPVAWLTLDKGENAPARFWKYFITALSTIPHLQQAGIGESILQVLRSLKPPAMEALLANLVNELSRLDGEAILVLDDLHTIIESEIHQDLFFLIDHLSLPASSLHLVVASRMDPPWPLARWRARGELVEIRTADLRFKPEEAADFLNRVMKLGLSVEDVRALEKHTEGWIAGLQLTALSLQGREDVQEFIEAFTGSNRFIFDYLVEEVLRQQPVDMQEFLLNTSILERLSASLCDVVLDSTNSQSRLDQLEKANMFLVPLDDEKCWYRYHHLFGDLLRSILLTTQAGLVPVLHQRASRWFKDAGFPEETIAHAFESGDIDLVASLIEQNAMQMIAQGKLHLLSAWLERLPAEMVRARPWLSVYWAWIRYYLGPRDRVEEYLRIAEETLQNMPSPSADRERSTKNVILTDVEKQHILGNIAAIQTLWVIGNEKIPKCMELAKKALELLPAMAPIRVLPTIALGFAHFGMGNTLASEQAFRDARAIAQAGGVRALSVSSTCYIGMQQETQGRLHEAYETYREALELSRGVAGKLLDIAGRPMAHLGDLLREWNELDKASEYITKSVELCERWGHVDFLTESYVALARLQLAQGNGNKVSDTIKKADQVIRKERIDPYIVCWLDEVRLRLWLSEGNLAEAVHWTQTSGLSPEGELHYFHDLDHINLARVLLAQGEMQSSKVHLQGAHVLLNRLLTAAQQAGWIHDEIKILTLQSLLLQACHDHEMALKVFSQALIQAIPCGYIRLFIDEGKPVKNLLLKAKRRGIAVEYASRLIAEIQASEGMVYAPGPPSLIEPLSQRELEILRLLNTSLDSTEIAAELYLSVSTVRTHIKNIYRKLNVNRRIQAVECAHDLKLL